MRVRCRFAIVLVPMMGGTGQSKMAFPDEQSPVIFQNRTQKANETSKMRADVSASGNLTSRTWKARTRTVGRRRESQEVSEEELVHELDDRGCNTLTSDDTTCGGVYNPIAGDRASVSRLPSPRRVPLILLRISSPASL